jgi:hypothetical protein
VEPRERLRLRTLLLTCSSSIWKGTMPFTLHSLALDVVFTAQSIAHWNAIMLMKTCRSCARCCNCMHNILSSMFRQSNFSDRDKGHLRDPLRKARR